MSKLKKPIIIGSGGFGREIAQYINDINKINYEYQILGFVDDDISKKDCIFNGIKVLGNLDILNDLNKTDEIFVFCAIANPSVKQQMSQRINKYGNKTINIIHPTAYLSPYISLGTNVLISPMCILTTNITIGDFVHLNPQCGIGHDTVIEDYSTLYWNVNTGGFVHIGSLTELGTKTFIKQGISIGNNVISGAGAVIVKDIKSNLIVKGVPAK